MDFEQQDIWTLNLLEISDKWVLVLYIPIYVLFIIINIHLNVMFYFWVLLLCWFLFFIVISPIPISVLKTHSFTIISMLYHWIFILLPSHFELLILFMLTTLMTCLLCEISFLFSEEYITVIISYRRSGSYKTTRTWYVW